MFLFLLLFAFFLSQGYIGFPLCPKISLHYDTKILASAHHDHCGRCQIRTRDIDIVGQPVVLSDPDGVEDGQTGLLVHTAVTWREGNIYNHNPDSGSHCDWCSKRL